MNDNKTVFEIINSIYQISEKAYAKINDLIEIENYKKGDNFISRNSQNFKEYFVLSGICKSYLINHEGEEITLSFFKDKTVITPRNARSSNTHSTLYFKALLDLTLASLNSIKFRDLMSSNAEIQNFANTVLQNELILKVEKEIDLASLTAKERLIKFRERYPNLENQIPHTDIASYLGITNISLSRLRRDLMK
jgi:CRP-like cAMP-binding protein